MRDRKLIKEFLDRANLDNCLMCGKSDCNCMSNELSSYEPSQYQDTTPGQAHHDMELNPDGTISPHELYHHFDLDDDGKVTPQEYVDHIKYHAAYPESLDHYNTFKEKSYSTVPCRNSYDSCSSHLLSQPDDVSMILSPLMDKSGSTCQLSTAQSLLDVLQSLINCGVIE